ncbi:hypothetical protein GCM10007933_02090 [Zoogloea oryzae]|uniref:Uncharacterized protein n=1 Tax=Zoogloea oryzae TaxID=310767 RepID=A0ABQ6F7T8_9RHOO|nr:hypothetical protein GCM10007933_02090 [Zoogloea oryzae]
MTQRRVQYGAVLTHIDLLATKQPITPTSKISVPRQINKQAQDVTIKALFGKVNQQAIELQGHLRKPRTIPRK